MGSAKGGCMFPGASRGKLGALGPDACLIYTLTFMVAFVQQTINIIFVLYASDEFGMSDTSAGVLYGWWGILASVWSAPLSIAIDVTGVKPMAIGSALLMCATRASIALTRSRYTLQVVFLGFSPIAEGLPGAVYLVGLKHVTSEEQRGMAFSITYSLNAAGGGMADILIDFLHQWHGADPEGFAVTFGGSLSPLRVCMLSTVFVLLASACLACALPSQLGPGRRSQLVVYKEFHEVDEDLCRISESTGTPSLQDNVRQPCGLRGVACEILELLGDRNLWFVALAASCLVYAKMQWHHMNATLPKYLIRELGESVPWATVNSFHFWTCTVLPPFVALGLTSYRDFPIVCLGTTIMAVAPVFMMLDISTPAACAWLAVMSLGEVIWSPRFNALSANLAPPGREGAFLVLAYTPQFFATLPTGWLSGVLLETYCPDCPSCRDSRTGSFCSVDCRTAGAPGGCAAQRPRCAAPGPSAGDCGALEPGLGGCPSSCASCPGWQQQADGRRLWLWVLGLSLLAPALLLLLRLTMPPPEARSAGAAGGAPAGEGGEEGAQVSIKAVKAEPDVIGAASLDAKP